MLTLKDRENIKTVKMINRRLSISIDNRSAIKLRLTKVGNDIVDKYRDGCNTYDYRRCEKVLKLMGRLEF